MKVEFELDLERMSKQDLVKLISDAASILAGKEIKNKHMIDLEDCKEVKHRKRKYKKSGKYAKKQQLDPNQLVKVRRVIKRNDHNEVQKLLIKRKEMQEGDTII